MDINEESERVHDLSEASSENLNHWLHYYLRGKVTLQQLQAQFDRAIETSFSVAPPWEEQFLSPSELGELVCTKIAK